MEKQVKSTNKKYLSVDEYLANFSGTSYERMKMIRAIIFKLEPNATEKISYNIPAFFKNNKMFIYFAGYANHVSLYPGKVASKSHKDLAKEYLSGASTLKFPNNKPFPIDLIEEFIKLRLSEVTKN